MKNLKKLFSLLLALTMVLTMAACGSGDTQESKPAQESNPGESQPVQNGGDKLYDGVKLVYWSNWEATETQGKIITEAVNEFMAETGAEVDLQFKGRTGIKEGLIPALDADQKVDMFDGAGNKSNFGDRIVSVEELMANADYEKDGNAAMMTLCRSYYADGKTREIPYQMKGNGFLYNKALFRQAGIDSVPTNWAEFEAVCQKLLDAGITPMTTDDAYTPQAFGIHLARMLGTEKVKTIVADGLWAETPEVLTTAKAFEDLAAKGYFSDLVASNTFPTGQNTEFATGMVAMYVCGTWLPNEVRNITGDTFEWGFFNYPEVDGGINGSEAMVIGCQSLAITSKCENPEAAFALISKITRGEWDAKLAEGTLGLPIDNANTKWPEQLADAKPYFDACTEIFAISGGLESNPNITPALKENLAKLYAGSITAEQFVSNMEAASQA